MGNIFLTIDVKLDLMIVCEIWRKYVLYNLELKSTHFLL